MAPRVPPMMVAESPEGWAPIDAGADWLDRRRPITYPTVLLIRCVPCYVRAVLRACRATGASGPAWT